MDGNILVTYASKYGSTAEIAENISKILAQSRLKIEIRPVGQVMDISPYKAIIMGTALYMGQWRGEAAKFIKANEALLSQKKVWLFVSGPTGAGDPKELVQGWHIPISLRPVVNRIHPVDVAVFHGSIKHEKLNFFEKWVIKQVKAAIGDFRDWKAINSWASSIAVELNKGKE